MTEYGVFLPPSQFEAWFLSTAFSKRDLLKFKQAVEIAMKTVAEKH